MSNTTLNNIIKTFIDKKKPNDEYFLHRRVFNIYILIFFVLVFISHIYSFIFSTPLRLTFFANLMFEAFLFFCLIKLKPNIKDYLSVIILILSFLIGQFFLDFRYFNINNLLNEIVNGDILQLNKYLFIFLFIIVYKKIFCRKHFLERILDIVIFVVYFNSFFVLIGLLFDFEVFRSYPYSERFGYMGLFNANTFCQFIYMLVITLVYKKYVTNNAKLWNLLYIIFIALLLGKKSVVIFINSLSFLFSSYK